MEDEEEPEQPAQTEDDDFLGLSSSVSRPHQRKHVDAGFEDFEITSTQTTHQQKQTAGSFWDDNEGEEDTERKDDFWDSSAPEKKKEPEAVDRFLDGIGDMFSIKISQDVHTNVKSFSFE